VVSAGGWGVGLLSTKASLVSHGGDLKVHSDASGSRVDICIPAAVAGFSANSSYRDSLSCISNFETSSATSLSDGGIDNSYGDVQLILVDDDVDHTESLERTLRRKGISAKSFKAVEDAFNFIATDVNVTVLCDTHMPNNQGAEYLLRLLSHANLKPTIGVMSGESSDFSLYRFAALGAREFFSKPIDIERLVDWVAQNNATSTVSKSAL
jgi:ActR/RegA family two-component response regulator